MSAPRPSHDSVPEVATGAKAPHFRANFTGSLGFVGVLLWELFLHLPRLLRLAVVVRRRRRHRTAPPPEPQVVFVGDNMDAVHGISVSAHRMARDLTMLGTPTVLVGVSHSRNAPGARGSDGRVQMLPAACIQDLFGYEGQELAFPSMEAWCDLLRTRRVDLIEIETPGAFGLLALMSALMLGLPVVHNYRTDLLAYTSLLVRNALFVEGLHWFIRVFLRSGGRVIVPSRAFEEEAVEMGVARARLRLLPRGVDLSRFQAQVGNPGLWKLRGAPEGPIVVYLGRVSKEKGLDVLAEAFEKVLSRVPGAVLGLIGDGPYRSELESRLSGTGRVVFAGEVTGTDLPGLLASSQVMAFPSTTDTFGNAVVEALACGIPAIVSDIGGPREIVLDGVCGRILPGGDADAFADAMVELLLDEELRGSMGRQAIERAKEFDPMRSNLAHQTVYRNLHRS